MFPGKWLVETNVGDMVRVCGQSRSDAGTRPQFHAPEFILLGQRYYLQWAVGPSQPLAQVLRMLTPPFTHWYKALGSSTPPQPAGSSV